MSIEAAKWLKSQLTPLSKDNDLPAPTSLTAWWKQTIRAIELLHDSITVEYLNHEAIQALGPFILGDSCFAVILGKLDPTSSWDDFEREVNALFGISKVRERRSFYALSPLADESSPAFVKRIEARRAVLSCEEEMCMLTFMPRLDLKFKQACKNVR